MALDYSKLSDEELEAIANEDYSKLSDRTLQTIASEPGPEATGDQALMAQGAATMAGPAARSLPTIGQAAMIPVRGVQDVANIARNVSGVPFGTIYEEMIKHPLRTGKAWAQGHPTIGPMLEAGSEILRNQSVQSAAGQVPRQISRGMGALGRAAMGAVMAPESMMALPYTATAYQMEKIRENPAAYPNVPYAQVMRGEQPTIGAAGAANRQQAIYQTPSGYQPTAQEAENILASGDERMMRIYGGRDALTEMIRRKAAEKVLAQ